MPDAPCSTAAQPAVKAGGVHRLDISLAEKLAAARRNGVLCFEDRYGSRYWFKEPSRLSQHQQLQSAVMPMSHMIQSRVLRRGLLQALRSAQPHRFAIVRLATAIASNAAHASASPGAFPVGTLLHIIHHHHRSRSRMSGVSPPRVRHPMLTSVSALASGPSAAAVHHRMGSSSSSGRSRRRRRPRHHHPP